MPRWTGGSANNSAWNRSAHFRGGIAHDFNNLLTPIVGHAEMLKDDIRNPDHLKSLVQIQIAAERARGLVQQILAFSGDVEPAGGTVNVAECVGQALDLVRATLPTTIDIHRFLDESSGAVAADPTQLTQVIVNLCTNSAHAMPKGGAIEVRVTHVEIDAEAAEDASGPGVGPHVRITVSDDGIGMEQAVSDRAFEPFFTTRDAGQGSGLGLSQVVGIVTAYGGAVILDSEIGVGTTAQVFFPAIALDPTPSPTLDEIASGGSARVLVVDDEPAVAGVACSMLESLGYTVAVEGSPAAALERFREAPDEFDLLVTDHTMPEMTGVLLAERVRAERPGLPTVLMSGHADPVGPIRDVVFLIKQFTRALSSAAVRGALESKGRSR